MDTLSAFDSGWVVLQAYKRTFLEITHGMNGMPGRAKVIYRADPASCQGDLCAEEIIFEGHGAAQADDTDPDREYGGVLYAVGINSMRVWAPDRTNVENVASAKLVFVGDGWGGHRGT